MNKNRPKHLALFKIKLPLPGVVSILHRVSGILLFLFLPFLLWAFQYSLRSIETWTILMGYLHLPLLKLVLLGIAWTFFHHLCAGIRYLLLDFHLGSDLPKARLSSKLVLVASLLLTLMTGVMIW